VDRLMGAGLQQPAPQPAPAPAGNASGADDLLAALRQLAPRPEAAAAGSAPPQPLALALANLTKLAQVRARNETLAAWIGRCSLLARANDHEWVCT
jgi:hypothetical protein